MNLLLSQVLVCTLGTCGSRLVALVPFIDKRLKTTSAHFSAKQLSSGKFELLLPDHTMEDSQLPSPSREHPWAASYQSGFRSQLVLIKHKILFVLVSSYLFIHLSN